MAGNSYVPDDSIACIFVKPNGVLASRRVRFNMLATLNAPWNLVRLVALHDTNLVQSPETVQWNDPDALPDGFETGVRYLVGSTPAGGWVGRSGEFATWDGDSWAFTPPTLNSDRGIVSSDPAPPLGESWAGQEGKVATFVGSGSGWSFADPDPPGLNEYDSNEELSLAEFSTPSNGVKIRKVNQSGPSLVIVEDYFVSKGDSGAGRLLPREPDHDVKFYFFKAGDDSQGSVYPAKLVEAQAIDPLGINVG